MSYHCSAPNVPCSYRHWYVYNHGLKVITVCNGSFCCHQSPKQKVFVRWCSRLADCNGQVLCANCFHGRWEPSF